MNTEDTLVQLLQLTSKLAAQVESISGRMESIEMVVTNDVRQDQKIQSIETSLKRGNDKFREIEARLDVLEDAEGNKAKSIVRTVLNYAMTAVLGFAAAAISFYLRNR